MSGEADKPYKEKEQELVELFRRGEIGLERLEFEAEAAAMLDPEYQEELRKKARANRATRLAKFSFRKRNNSS